MTDTIRRRPRLVRSCKTAIVKAKELPMDSQFDGSFTDLLMSNTDLYDDTMRSNPAILASVQDEVVLKVRKSQRTKNFSQEEDKLIVSAWLNTSKDAITGNEQQGGAFWNRILKYLELHGGNQEERSQASFKNRWTDINAKCVKFVGFYSQIERLRQSGHTEQNNVDEAKEMFAKIIRRPFQYEHCWNILKMERKWTDNLTSNKRAKTHSTGSPTESNHVESCYSTPHLGDDIEPSSTPNLNRPLGRKVSKKQFKNKEKQTGAEDILDYHHWNQRMEVERQKAERHEKMFAQ
ncbi:glutathione S-transferase T3-like [Diospyros lotus]|uniref:glutathione S-transferase T3-like n=1 Tax=Diospyros lotus TaxID=55363 RepID=UPI00224FA46F|nr:glutathione S-transferase T3-like [Diospyros lotus]